MSDREEAVRAAAAAARDADPVPEYVLTGTPIGECECGARFEYGRPGTDQSNLDPCPECGSYDWEKAGYRTEDGKEVSGNDV